MNSPELMRCIFCGRAAGTTWALTACNGDPDDSASWRREVLPVCPRCNRLLDTAGAEGVKVKRTGERWFGGLTIGRFKTPRDADHGDDA